MKLNFYKRNDFTSLSVVGDNVMRELKKQHEVIEQDICQPLSPEVCELGIVYGLPQDVAYLKRHNRRIAGLVCEMDLNEKEIGFLKKAELEEIWLPSQFCADIYKKVGFENVRIVPHGVDNVPIGKCLEDNILMIYASYKSLSWTTHRKNPFKAIEAAQRFHKKIILRTEKQRYYNRQNFDGVEFVGYQENLDNLYDRCSCILCPSESEGFGFIGLDALARGIPLISTRTGNDYLEGMSYVHIDLPVSVDKIYVALEELYNHWDEYSDKAIAQRDKVLNNWSWSNIFGGKNAIM